MQTTVLVDAWHLSGHSADRGIGTYLRNVTPLLIGEPGLRLVALAQERAQLPPGVCRRRLRRMAPPRFAQREHELMLPFDLRRAASGEAVDVFWSPADDPPRRSPCPWVQFLHDVIPLAVRDPALGPAAARWRRIGPRLLGASAVITNSRHTADDATRYLGIEPARLHVAALGVAPEFAPPAKRTPTDPPTILYVGEYGPHKGFAEAFAVTGLLADAGLPHRLAMASTLAPWYKPIVEDLRAQATHPERIDLLGYVDDLVAVYQQADALIVTSRYEGFCLPAVEAMACGTPVVAFANSAIGEVVAGGGVLVPDGDVGAMADALRGVLAGGSAWRAASDRALERARAFSWAQCAAIHADVFRQVADQARVGRA